MGHLIQNKRQSGTIKSYISAIKAVLMGANIKINEDQYLLTSLINDEVRTRLPIHKGMLRLLLEPVDRHYHKTCQPFLQLLYKTLISTMYFGLFRVSELTSGAHPVLSKDVHIGMNKKKMLFILRTSKTHWKNVKPQLVKISTTCHKTCHQSPGQKKKQLPCPYELLRKYAKRRGSYETDNEPFFVFSDRSPVRPEQLRRVLKTILREAGFNEHAYDTHSLRTRRTCDLYKLGISVETIKNIGRWKSNAVFKYLRD